MDDDGYPRLRSIPAMPRHLRTTEIPGLSSSSFSPSNTAGATDSAAVSQDPVLNDLLGLPSPPTAIRAQRASFLDRLPSSTPLKRSRPSYTGYPLSSSRPAADDTHHIGLNQYHVANAQPSNFSCLFAAILLAERAHAERDPDFRRWNYQACIKDSARLYQAYTLGRQLPTFAEALEVIARERPAHLALFQRTDYVEQSDYAESRWGLAAKLYVWLDRIASDPRPCIIVLICGTAAHCLTVRPAEGAAHRTIHLLDTHGDWQSPQHIRQNYYTSGTSAEPLARYLTHETRVPAHSRTFEARAFFISPAPTSSEAMEV